MRGGSLTILLLALSPAALGLQVLDVSDGRTVTAQVSARELTRVTMAGDRRVVRVWGLEERMTVEPDADGGQVFIRPVQQGPARPFSFFVKDDTGATYTVVAVPVDMPADAIVLRPGRAREPARGSVHPFVDAIKTLVHSLANGITPGGYAEITLEAIVPLWKEGSLTLVRRYEGDLTGEIYRLTNISEAEMRLDERELGVLGGDIEAIGIERHVLAPGESTSVYLVREAR